MRLGHTDVHEGGRTATLALRRAWDLRARNARTATSSGNAALIAASTSSRICQ